MDTSNRAVITMDIGEDGKVHAFHICEDGKPHDLGAPVVLVDGGLVMTCAKCGTAFFMPSVKAS